MTNMKKYLNLLVLSILLSLSSNAISSDKFLACDAKSQTYGSSWTGKSITGEITVTISEVKQGLIISLSGHPDFVVAAMGFNSKEYEGNNYSNSNKYVISTKERFGKNSTQIDLNRVTGFLDVYSQVLSDGEMITWRITGKCQPMSQQRKF